MKFFIYLCCIAHLLTDISARLRLTTPMPSVNAAGQDLNIAKMIDFINSVYNDGGRTIARSGRYDPNLRRFEPVVQGIDNLPSLEVRNYEDTENQLEKLRDTARYHVIHNPEVLEEYSKKQKLKNIARPLKVAPVISETSAEARSFSTVEKKLRYYHSKSKSAASLKSTESYTFNESYHTPKPNPLDSHQELTTVERTYRPSFPDDDDDDDKLVPEDIEVTVTEKEIHTPRIKAKHHGGHTKKQPVINNTVEIEKTTVDNKALHKGDQSKIEEEKAQIADTKEIGQIKQEISLKTEKYNDAVTVVEEKSGSYKEYTTNKLDHNSNERPSEGSVRSRDEYDKNDGNKLINGTTNTNKGKDKKPTERSWDTNIVTNVPVERLMARIDKSALRTKQNNDHDHKEQHSIHAQAHKERKEISNEHFKNRHEKRDKYGIKKKDKIDDGWSKVKKEKDWNKIVKQRYNKDIGYDTMEHDWNKRHQQYDENDNLDMNDNQWDKNDDFNSRDYDSNMRDDDWDKRDNDWNKSNNNWDKIDNDWKKRDNFWNDTDIDLKKRDSDWNKRDIHSNKRENDWDKRDFDSNKRDDDWNKRDVDSNKRDNDWNKRENEWIKKASKPYKNDRNKNDWDSKYSAEMSLENDRGNLDRYEIVDRKRQDGDFIQHSEV